MPSIFGFENIIVRLMIAVLSSTSTVAFAINHRDDQRSQYLDSESSSLSSNNIVVDVYGEEDERRCSLYVRTNQPGAMAHDAVFEQILRSVDSDSNITTNCSESDLADIAEVSARASSRFETQVAGLPLLALPILGKAMLYVCTPSLVIGAAAGYGLESMERQGGWRVSGVAGITTGVVASAKIEQKMPFMKDFMYRFYKAKNGRNIDPLTRMMLDANLKGGQRLASVGSGVAGFACAFAGDKVGRLVYRKF